MYILGAWSLFLHPLFCRPLTSSLPPPYFRFIVLRDCIFPLLWRRINRNSIPPYLCWRPPSFRGTVLINWSRFVWYILCGAPCYHLLFCCLFQMLNWNLYTHHSVRQQWKSFVRYRNFAGFLLAAQLRPPFLLFGRVLSQNTPLPFLYSDSDHFWFPFISTIIWDGGK